MDGFWASVHEIIFGKNFRSNFLNLGQAAREHWLIKSKPKVWMWPFLIHDWYLLIIEQIKPVFPVFADLKNKMDKRKLIPKLSHPNKERTSIQTLLVNSLSKAWLLIQPLPTSHKNNYETRRKDKNSHDHR